MKEKQRSSQEFNPFSLQDKDANVDLPSPRAGSAPDSPQSAAIFDPFGLGSAPPLGGDASSTESPRPPPQVTRYTRSAAKDSAPSEEICKRKPKGNATSALPPKLVIKFTVHEEVSSFAKGGDDSDGASEISVEGTLHATVHSSDAKKNSPFALVASSYHGKGLSFQGADRYVKAPEASFKTTPAQTLHVVTVPKSEIGGVTIGKYTLTESVRHMPILVERKTTFYGKKCRIMVQVRSKLNNIGNMTDFTISVAFPERVNAETVEVTRGDGTWDDLKRTIKWIMPVLPRGESIMICAQAELWSPVADDDDQPIFPVLLRCSSAHDQISSAQFRAGDAEGYPANIAYSRTSSFRLLHRVV